ncbi:MAG: hypothetical protein ACOVVK_18910 [Elsteraceae bacterium]
MKEHLQEFEVTTLQKMLEKLHDAAIDYRPETVDKMNEMKEIAWDYLRSKHLSAQQWETVRSLLSHPKATVRIWVAVEFLNIGVTDVWPLLIREAEPRPARVDQSLEDQIRDSNARLYAWGLLGFIERQFPHLNLRPTFAEIQAQWVAEGKR